MVFSQDESAPWDQVRTVAALSLAAARARLDIESIGYLVPRPAFEGAVHSIHARACNIRCGEVLLTLLTAGAPEGPTALVLRSGFALDLRRCFRLGDVIVCRGGRLRSSMVEGDLSRALVWKPPPMPNTTAAAQIDTNLRVARARIAASMRDGRSILHREAHAVCRTLEEACRDCDGEPAVRDATRLIGWGEGLTPAGDDFLVGLMSGLGALAGQSPIRTDFLKHLGGAIVAQLVRTTPIAAHYLRLGAQGHFAANAHQLRNALLSANDVAAVRQYVDDTLTLGATSGSDLVTGMVSGISAWRHPQLSHCDA